MLRKIDWRAAADVWKEAFIFNVRQIRGFLGFLNPEDEGTMILGNVGDCQSTWCNISEDLNLSFKIEYKVIKKYDRTGHCVKCEVYAANQTQVVVA